MSATDWHQATGVLETFPGTLAAWEFGSPQRGELAPGGRLDIAAPFYLEPCLEQYVDLRENLRTAAYVSRVTREAEGETLFFRHSRTQRSAG